MSRTLEITHPAETASREVVNLGRQVESCPSCGGNHVFELLRAPDRFHLRCELYRLLRCRSCNSVWQENPPQPRLMALHYTEEYHQAIVAAGEGSANQRWRDQVKQISHHKSGGAILDIGCSSGGFLSTMRGPAWQLFGIEMEESTAARAHASTGAQVFVGDVMAAPFAPANFDVITCFDVLEHVYSPRQLLSKVWQWLKPGGIYYAMLPNIDSWEARIFGSYWFGLEMPRHISHFSPRSLRYLLTDLGYEEVILKTPPVSYIERSVRYVGASMLERLGFTPTPQATPKPVSIPLKVVRKGLRVGVVWPLAHVASMAGAGPCLEVVFRKPADTRR
jgi:2-polyprenyl-3-methyl-5-hydroxy-6-metoxy-1,4-benzoquinol methylase